MSISKLHPAKSIVDYANALMKRAKRPYAVVSAAYGEENRIELTAVDVDGRKVRMAADYSLVDRYALRIDAIHPGKARLIDPGSGRAVVRQHHDGVVLRPSRKAVEAHIAESIQYQPHDAEAFKAFLAAEIAAIRKNDEYGAKPSLSRASTTIRDLLAQSDDRSALLLLNRMEGDMGKASLEDMGKRASKVRPYQGLRAPDAALVRKVVAGYMAMPSVDQDKLAERYEAVRSGKPSVAAPARPKSIPRRAAVPRIKMDERASKAATAARRKAAAPVAADRELPPAAMLYPSEKVVDYANFLCDRFQLRYIVDEARMVDWDKFVLKARHLNGTQVEFVARAHVSPDFSLTFESFTDAKGTRLPERSFMDYKLTPANRVVWDYLATIRPNSAKNAIQTHVDNYRGAVEYTVFNKDGVPVVMTPIARTRHLPLLARRTGKGQDGTAQHAPRF